MTILDRERIRNIVQAALGRGAADAHNKKLVSTVAALKAELADLRAQLADQQALRQQMRDDGR